MMSLTMNAISTSRARSSTLCPCAALCSGVIRFNHMVSTDWPPRSIVGCTCLMCMARGPCLSETNEHLGQRNLPDTRRVLGFFFWRSASPGSVGTVVTPRLNKLCWPCGRCTVSVGIDRVRFVPSMEVDSDEVLPGHIGDGIHIGLTPDGVTHGCWMCVVRHPWR